MGLCAEVDIRKIAGMKRVALIVFSGVLALAVSVGFGASLVVRPLLVALFSLIFFAASWGLFYLFWEWLLVTRPNQVRKNVPITSAEWRRRQKQLYNNLPRS